MNTYHIQKSGSNKDYLELVEGLAWTGLTFLNIDYASSLVLTDGTTTDPRAELQIVPSRKDEFITQLDTDCDDTLLGIAFGAKVAQTFGEKPSLAEK